MRRTLALYMPSVVLLGWAALWAVGVQTTGVVVGSLVAEAAAIFFHVREQIDTYRSPEPQPTFRMQRRAEDRRRTYRDLWLVVISGIVVWALFSIQDQQDQFCGLINARLNDYDVRIKQSRDFLKSPAARESPELSNTVRTISIPSLKHQRALERRSYPDTCR